MVSGPTGGGASLRCTQDASADAHPWCKMSRAEGILKRGRKLCDAGMRRLTLSVGHLSARCQGSSRRTVSYKDRVLFCTSPCRRGERSPRLPVWSAAGRGGGPDREADVSDASP